MGSPRLRSKLARITCARLGSSGQLATVHSQDIDQMAGVPSDFSDNNAVAMEMNIQPDNKTTFTGDCVGFDAI
jgi:hypothetical protein